MLPFTLRETVASKEVMGISEAIAMQAHKTASRMCWRMREYSKMTVLSWRMIHVFEKESIAELIVGLMEYIW